MAKHIQTIRRQIDAELFECVWPFCEIGTWRVKKGSTFKLESSDREFILKSNFHGEIPNLCLIYDGCKEQ